MYVYTYVYACVYRFYYIGVMVLFLHDISDVILEGAKTITYFRVMDGKKHKMIKNAGDVGFATFVISWSVYYSIHSLSNSFYLSTSVSNICNVCMYICT